MRVEGDDEPDPKSPRCIVSNRLRLGHWRVLLTRSSERILPTVDIDSSPVGGYCNMTEEIERAPD